MSGGVRGAFVTLGLALIPVLPASAQQLGLTPEPLAVIGGQTEDPRYLLDDVVGALRLDDGRIVIGDRFTQGLRLYGPDGEYLGEAGGEGAGPGEYEHIRGLARCDGENVVAFDLHWDQKIYDADLRLLDERPASFPGVERTPYEFACAPSGHWIASGWGDHRAQFREGLFVSTAPVVFGRGGELIAELGTRLSSERVGYVDENDTPTGSGPHPFGRETTFAIGPSRLYVGDGSRYAIERYDLQGRVLPPIEWSGPDRTATEAHFEAFAERRIAERGGGAEARRTVNRWVRDMPRLEQFPAYDRMHATADGRLWVRLFPQPGMGTATWVVRAARGRVRAGR